MKGYKATKNFKCINQTYKVGYEYKSDKLKMCKHGFHFCKNMSDVLNHYDYDKDLILLEVEAIGNIESEGDKSVTDHIKIIGVVPEEEYTFQTDIKFELDSMGNIISATYPNGDKYIYEYDDKNNMISKTYPNNIICRYEYDNKNNMISKTWSSGNRYTYEYDDRNNIISDTLPDGRKTIYEYDDKGNKISEICSSGSKLTYEIPEQTNVTEIKSQ